MTTYPDRRTPGQPLKKHLMLEASRDAERLRKALIRIVCDVEVSHMPMPAGLVGNVTTEQWVQSQRDMRERAIAEARAALAAPSWILRLTHVDA